MIANDEPDDEQEVMDVLEDDGFRRQDISRITRSQNSPGDLVIKLELQTQSDKDPGESLIALAEHYREEYDGHLRLRAGRSDQKAILNVFEGQHDDLDRSELRGEISHR